MLSIKKISLYWYCQFLGWGAALIYWSYYSIPNELPWDYKLLQLFLPFVFSIWVTHFYKNWAHRNGVLRLSIQSLLPQLFVALILLTLGYCIVSFLIGSFVFDHWLFSAIPGMVSGGIRYMAIWLLAFHLYHYAKRESKLEVEKSQLEARALQAQLDALTHELNPHFLFNALNSIKALVNENPGLAKKAIVLLSNLLRHSLNHSADSLTTLEKEMKAVQDYLEMEKLRLEERLAVQFEIPDGIEKLRVPTLSLLSLVENAVKHGIAPANRGGLLKIKMNQEKEQLQIRILNHGKLEEEDSRGTGNINLRARLQLLYKRKATLNLTQVKANTIETRLIIPVER